MTKEMQPKITNNTPTELIISKSRFEKSLDKRIEEGKELYSQPIISTEDLETYKQNFYRWDNYNSELLKRSFNKDNNEYKQNYDDADFLFCLPEEYKSFYEKVVDVKKLFFIKINNLKQLKEKVELLRSNQVMDTTKKYTTPLLDKSKVFIVHGHDEAAKSQTARFIEKLGLEPIILHEQVSGSKTVIEKIEAYSNVGFGIVLYTPCDIGAKKGEEQNLKNRARQNVVFEHGFLIGKIGRENVCALIKGDIEIPNDISGVVYIKMDEAEGWKLQIAKELKRAGYNVDMNNI